MTPDQVNRILDTYFPTARDRVIRESTLRKVLSEVFSTTTSPDTTMATSIVTAENISVTDATDGQEITHTRGSQKLAITFYLGGTVPTNTIGWEPVGPNKIKIYLPVLDEGLSLFTGDIYIQSRT